MDGGINYFLHTRKYYACMQYWLDTLQNTLFILSKYKMYIALDIKRDKDNSEIGLLKSIYVT